MDFSLIRLEILEQKQSAARSKPRSPGAKVVVEFQ